MALFNKRLASHEVHVSMKAGAYLGEGSKVSGKLNFEGSAESTDRLPVRSSPRTAS
jgi:hypothetical protein